MIIHTLCTSFIVRSIIARFFLKFFFIFIRDAILGLDFHGLYYVYRRGVFFLFITSRDRRYETFSLFLF